MKKKKIKDTSKPMERIVNTGPRYPRVEPAEVAKALGGELVTFEELPKDIQRAASSPILARRRRSE